MFAALATDLLCDNNGGGDYQTSSPRERYQSARSIVIHNGSSICTHYTLQRLLPSLPKTNAHLGVAHGPALCTSAPPGTVSAPPIAVPDGAVIFICGVGSMPPPLALPCFAFAERRLFASFRCFASKSSSLKPLSKQEPQHPLFPVSAS